MPLWAIQTNVWYNTNTYSKPGTLGQNYFLPILFLAGTNPGQGLTDSQVKRTSSETGNAPLTIAGGTVYSPCYQTNVWLTSQKL